MRRTSVRCGVNSEGPLARDACRRLCAHACSTLNSSATVPGTKCAYSSSSGAVSGHFLEVGCDTRAQFGAPGLEGFLEAVKVIGLAAGDRHPAQGGGRFAAGMIAGKDRGQPDQVGPGWVVLEGPGAGVQVEVKHDVGAASFPCPVAQCVDAAWVSRARISHGMILGYRSEWVYMSTD